MIEQAQTMLDTLAVSFDFPVLEFIRNHLTNPILDKAMPIITLFGDAGIFWIAVALLLLIFPKTRKAGWSMGVALVLGVVVCNITLKPMIARVRPYEFFRTIEGWDPVVLLVKAPSDFSFPSGHTIASFEACTALMVRDKRMGIPATILAILIAFSRLYLYVHYVTDVLFAVVGGILFGLIGCGIVSIVYKIHPPKRGKYELVA